ncbi:MAG: EAL domain-containing protein [Salinarimonas sp.]|nr:EAL domain-containing protein [Salinarimonas sp.]
MTDQDDMRDTGEIDLDCPWEETARQMARAVSNLGRIETELLAYQNALDQHAIVGITDRRGVITAVNEPFCRISGYEQSELLGKTHAILNSGVHGKEFFRTMWRTIATGGTWRGEICNRTKCGKLYWVDSTIAPIKAECGRIEGYLAIRIDITERKIIEAERAAEIEARTRAETLLRDVIEAIPDGVAAFDTDDRLILWNQAFLTTYPKVADVIRKGMPFSEMVHLGVERGQFPQAGTTPARQRAWIEACLRDHIEATRPILRDLGDGRWIQVRESRSVSGHRVGVRTDITELKRAEGIIRRQAERDPLTGLGNRKALIKRLAATMRARKKDGDCGALFFLDLDNLKQINDTLGHDAGDHLIATLAERLSAYAREGETVARIGGDEFAIVIPRLTDMAEAIAYGEDLLAMLDAPLRMQGRSIAPRCSIGLALLPTDARTAKEAFKHADIALYQAKARGRGTLCVFDPAMKAELEERRAIADDLAIALLADEVDIALQPKTAFKDGRHTGFEALVRWQRNGAPVPPPLMVSVAEENALIVALGYRVFELALTSIRALTEAGLEPGSVAVNVAAMQLRQDDFVARVLGLLDKHGLPPSALEIEVTEHVLLDGAGDGIAQTLADLRAQGIRVSLDDFGTGYASLTHLKRFPVDCLKVDKSFVRDIGRDPDDAILTRTIITLAHSLGMEAVAEGIESAEQYQFLEEQGCDYAQGYLIARPIARRDVADYLRGLAALGPVRTGSPADRP